MREAASHFSQPGHVEALPVEPPLNADLVQIGGVQIDALREALRQLQVAPRSFSHAEVWLSGLADQASRGEESGQPELVVLVGDTAQIANEGWVTRIGKQLPFAQILVAVSSADLKAIATLLRQGARSFVELPAAAEQLASNIDWLVREASESRTRTRDAVRHRANMGRLTQAELDVLQHMLAGLANKQIAIQLGIGLRTVELRRSKIMRKMEATTVAQLIRYVYESAVDVGQPSKTK